MSKEWVKGKPWYKVRYAANKGTYWEYENCVEVQAKSEEEATKIVQEDIPLVNICAAYRK